jgi:hypothetical protein
MNKVSLDEIVGLERYEKIRDEFRRRIIEKKKRRRVSVGDRVTFVFEDHDTMLFQIQEMVRAEHIVDLDRIRDELEVYNALVPEGSEFSTTMLIEITDADDIRGALVRLIGIDECVSLRIGADHRIAARFEAGHSKEDKLSAVQYVRFSLDAAARDAFIAGEPVRLCIEHPSYRHEAAIEGAVREELTHDLTAA